MKKTIVKICLLLAPLPTFASPDVAAKLNSAKTLAVHELTVALTTSQTLGTLVEGLHAKLDAKNFTFLQQKINGLENARVKIEQVGELKFRIQSGEFTLPLEIHEYQFDGIVRIELNHHSIELNMAEGPEVAWGKLNGALPKSASIWSFLPAANATDEAADIAGTAGLLGIKVSTQAAAESYAESQHCSAYDSFIRFCGFLSAEQVQKGAELGNSWAATLSLFCRADKRVLRQCLQKQARKIHYSPPDSLANYFDLKSQPVQEVNLPSSNSVQ